MAIRLLLLAALIAWPLSAAETAPAPPKTVLSLTVKNQRGETVLKVIVDTSETPDLADWGQRTVRRVRWQTARRSLAGLRQLAEEEVVMFYDPKEALRLGVRVGTIRRGEAGVEVVKLTRSFPRFVAPT